jgi:GDP-4-dehydro-6-deoxy-D-mannose reductase
MDKLLILGINGFTGKHILRYIDKHRLLEIYKITGVDKHVESGSEIETIKSDLCVKNKLESVLSSTQPDYILNLIGAYKRGLSFRTLLEVNALIARNLFDIILRNNLNVKKTLVIGTAAEYGSKHKLPIIENVSEIPLNEYGLTKSIQTSISLFYQQNFGMNICVARPFNIIGKDIPADLAIGSFVKQIQQAKNGDTISVGNLSTKRDYLYIDDIISAYFSILNKGKIGEIYNICSGESYGMNEILSYLIKLSRKRIHIKIKPELVKKDDINDIYGDNRKLIEDTQWKKCFDIWRSLEMLMKK